MALGIPDTTDTTIVGVISDTHGLVRRTALGALAGSDLILHAGDVGARSVLARLEQLGPTRAVRGNTDSGSLGAELPGTAWIEVGQCVVYLLHDLDRLDLDPETAGVAVVVSGHTHRPANVRRGNVLYFNPGSAGPRRAGLPITVGRLIIHSRTVRAEHIVLD
jgi:putative phosphoesterase